jgi:hypothetical protein
LSSLGFEDDAKIFRVEKRIDVVLFFSAVFRFIELAGLLEIPTSLFCYSSNDAVVIIIIIIIIIIVVIAVVVVVVVDVILIFAL